MRQSAKWALLGLGLLAVSALTVGLILVAMLSGAKVPREAVLVVRASGSLVDQDSRSALEQALGGEIDTLSDLTRSIDRAAADPRIRAVRLELGSLDAGYARVQELRDALERFRAAGKPVVAQLETASMREYYLASVADRVAVLPGGILMVTGLMADLTFFKGTLDKLGIRGEFESAGEYKSAAEMWTRDSMSEANRRATEAILESLYAQIVDDIAASRSLSAAEVTRAVNAGLLTPDEAREMGLVDDLLYEDEIQDWIEEDLGAGDGYTEIRVRAYKKTDSLHLGRRHRIAVVHASGAIVSGQSGAGAFGDEFIGSDSMVRLLRQVREDGGIEAVVLRVDSPGGSGVASDAIWREIVRFREDRKPLVVSMSDVAASGGYYIAMGATAIVAEPATITGSIGVVSGKFNLRGFYEDWLGIRREQIKKGESADLFSDYQGFTDAQRARIRSQIEGFYRMFVQKAAEGRGRQESEIERVAQGRIWTGAQAKEIGLVDELGGLDRALDIAREKAGLPADARVLIESHPRPRSLWDMFSAEEEVGVGSRLRLPPALARALSALEVRERLARDGVILWTEWP